MSTPPPGTKTYKANEVIFKEGDISDSLYLIKNGSVAIRKRKAGGYIELSKLFSNEVLGELSFFDRKPRSASAVALTDVELMEIKFDALDVHYMKIPDYLRTIVTSLADRLRKADGIIQRLQKDVNDDVTPPVESPGEPDEDPKKN